MFSKPPTITYYIETVNPHRYQKCLRQGMLKEGVRLDRVRGGRQKYRRFPADGHPQGFQARKVSAHIL